jgi:uncharacterized phage-associated protein
MENVRDIASWYLSHEPMTHKKLQKLCYYAQAWYCTLYDGTPLFEDEIEAWVHGPVIPAIYRAYSGYQWNDIPQQDFDEAKFSESVLDILESVWETYGKFTGNQLESLTHSEDPWKMARGDLKPWEICTAPISRESMRAYYGKLYKESQGE